MKNLYVLASFVLFAAQVNAQVGIGTVSPNSTLDLQGSFSAIYRSFSGATALTANDYNVVFTGGSATTATLPDATGCAGRAYCIKNFSPGPLPATLTLGTVGGQKIDGLASWTMDGLNEAMTLVSDGANWEVINQDVPVNSTATTGGSWNEGGNSVSAIKSLGTTSNFDLPFITNNTEKMRIMSAGNIGVGSIAFSVNPEALLVYQTNATSFNVIAGKGNLNNYLQLNIQNLNSGTNASSDVVATADNGNELTNYVDMGMNSSGNTSGAMGSPDDAYLYTAGNNFLFGTANAGKALIFLTGGTTQATNERMRITGTGDIGIGNNNPAYLLDVNGAIRTGDASATNGSLVFSNSTNANTVTLNTGATTATYGITLPAAQGGANTVLGNNGAGVLSWTTVAAAAGSWSTLGNAGTVSTTNFLGTTNNVSLSFRTNDISHAILDSTGNLGIGTAVSFNAIAPEKLLVNAGATTSFNAVVAKGSLNNYFQLNINNQNSGSSASSDVVATADNGTETINYVDLGINSSTYNTAAITGGVNNAYLYSTGNDFIIGNSVAGKNLIFFTGGTATANEAMRINSAGNIGISTTTPAANLDVSGTVKIGTAGTVLNSIIRFTNQSITDNTIFTYNQTVTETFTLAGVNKFASVVVTPRSALQTGVGIAFAIATAANTVQVTFINASGNNVSLGTVAFDITIIQ